MVGDSEQNGRRLKPLCLEDFSLVEKEWRAGSNCAPNFFERDLEKVGFREKYRTMIYAYMKLGMFLVKIIIKTLRIYAT